VALAAADEAGINEMLLVMAVVFGASSSFANPIGCKTNLLVFGPGGYRFRDFSKVVIGLDLMPGAIGVLPLPWFWPF
jgi:di/tricarboxylate transporter